MDVVQEKDESYLKRLSYTLRNKVASPLVKLTENPIYDDARVAEDVGLSQQQHGAFDAPGIPASHVHNRDQHYHAEYGPPSSQSSSIQWTRQQAVLSGQLHSLPRPPQGPTTIQHRPYCTTYSPQAFQPSWAPAAACTTLVPVSSTSPNQYHGTLTQQPPWGLSTSSTYPRKGTLGGPYQGYASAEWLESEMQRDVHELARHVDTCTTQREIQRFELERAALLGQIEELKSQRSALQQQVDRLETMLPDQDGEFKPLAQRLVQLEQECAQHQAQYRAELSHREEAEKLLMDAQGHVSELQQQLLGSQPRHGPSHPGAMGGAGELAGKSIEEGGAVVQLPDAGPGKTWIGTVLSRRWPSWEQVVVRLVLVLTLLCSLAGCILLTHYLTKLYSC